MNWTTWDITFCGDKCANDKCYRNPARMPDEERKWPHTYAQFKDTDYCEGYKPLAEKGKLNE